MACFHVCGFCDSKILEIQDPISGVLTPGPNAFRHDPSCGDRKFISLSQDVSILWKHFLLYLILEKVGLPAVFTRSSYSRPLSFPVGHVGS